MNEKQFCKLTCKSFNNYAKFLGIKNPNKYMELTDFSKDFVLCNTNKCNIAKTDSINFLFAEMCYHFQNTSHGVGPFLQFSDNWKIIMDFFEGFNPKSFKDKVNHFVGKDLKDKINNCTKVLVDEILNKRYFVQCKDYLYKKVKDEPNKAKINNANNLSDLAVFFNLLKKDMQDNVIKNRGTVCTYAKHMYKFACKICNLESRHDFIDELKNAQTPDDPFSGPINYIKSIDNLSGIALICDFIKELDEHFNNFCKPDLHLKRAIDKFYGRELDEDIMYLSKVNEIIQKCGDKKITCYKLDRMIYILGSGSFFLDDNATPALKYLNSIK